MARLAVEWRLHQLAAWYTVQFAMQPSAQQEESVSAYRRRCRRFDQVVAVSEAIQDATRLRRDAEEEDEA